MEKPSEQVAWGEENISIIGKRRSMGANDIG
jgi:hypothetical protein